MKKHSQLDFELFGKEVATDYLTSNIPMNDAIVKIAEAEGLNHHQVNRIVEEANTNAYLQKFNMKSGDDKYIEFDVADSKKIAAARAEQTKVAVKNTTDDYLLRPNEHFNDVKHVTTVVTNTKEISETEKNAMVFKARGIEDVFKTKMDNLSYEFNSELETLNQHFKVAQLDLDQPSPVVLKQVLSAAVSKLYPVNSTETKLASHVLEQVNMPRGEKLASVPVVINADHQAMQALKNVVKLGAKYVEEYNTGPDMQSLRDLGYPNEKTASHAAAVESTLWKLLIAAGLVSAGVAASHRAGYKKGMNVQAIRMSPMKELPPGYNPRG